jgi:hypothetical protein
MISNLLFFNLIVTAMLTGLIWTIQLVHYPSFRFIRENDFSEFEKFHCHSVSFIVAPLMLMELVLASLLLNFHLDSEFFAVVLITFSLVLLVWLSTLIFQMPYHNKLAKGYDPLVQKLLVKSNWIRTIAWSIRLILLIWLILI